jgi:hypothetical protein
MHISAYICVHPFRRCYTRFGAYPNYTHIQIIVKNNLLGKKLRKNRKENTAAQIGLNVMVSGFNAGLLARSQFASGRS